MIVILFGIGLLVALALIGIGYLIETKEGFQFRSIDNLISQDSKATYTYTQVNKSNIDRDNDFVILNYKTER